MAASPSKWQSRKFIIILIRVTEFRCEGLSVRAIIMSNIVDLASRNMWNKKRMAKQATWIATKSQEEVIGLCSKTEFVRKEKADLLNPRKSKK